MLATLQPCDLVMKGGVTSGIVYPAALRALSEKYRFCNIGGTSAGAIAAGCAAAAEYARQKNSSKPHSGFAGFTEISEWLGKDGNLRNLFQANPPTRPVMNVLMAFMAMGSGTFARVLGMTAAFLTNMPLAVLAGALASLVLALPLLWMAWSWASVGDGGGHVLRIVLAVAASVIALAIVWIGGLIAGAAYLAIVVFRRVPRNSFGLCRGHLDEPPPHPVLTDWLSEKLNELAGLQPNGEPLTFRQLAEIDVTLKMVTTNLSHSQPYELPFEKRHWVFRKSEIARLFPPNVVDHLVTKSAKAERLSIQLDDFYLLPEPQDLPVAVAMRMSLSFPVLLSAVPLYRPRFGIAPREGDRTIVSEIGHLEPCWFSDGGISSNFPIHFFDAWLPTRPTFGIDLQGMPAVAARKNAEARRDEEHRGGRKTVERQDGRVYIRKAGGQPQNPEWKPVTGLAGFLSAIWNTAQNFRDNMQSMLPSYDERIAHIRLDDTQGGLNLNMAPETVKAVQAYGLAAGELLRDEFDFAIHQRTRALVFLPQFERGLKVLKTALTSEAYRRWREGGPEADGPYSRNRGAAWWEAAGLRINELLNVIAAWEALDVQWLEAHQIPAEDCFFPHEGPKPEPALRVVPKP